MDIDVIYKMSRFRNACITWNNYPEDAVPLLTTFANDNCSFSVYGKEVSTTGTPHLQIYLEFKDKISLKKITKALDNSHVEARRGTSKQAAGYCMKGECNDKVDYAMYWESGGHDTWDGEFWGELSEHGKRNDIHAVVGDLQEGSNVREIARDHPVAYVKFHRGIERLRQQLQPERYSESMPEVIVLWGPTGTGKTERSELFYWPDEPHFVWSPQMGSWFDGYDGEKKIVLDEFRGQLPFATLLRLLDRYSCSQPVKGGFVQVQATKFVITSPLPPDKWYKLECEYDRYEQLLRRFTEVIYTGSGCSTVLPTPTSGQFTSGQFDGETVEGTVAI